MILSHKDIFFILKIIKYSQCNEELLSIFIFDFYKAAEGKVPVEVINMRDYGMMNGANVLKRALEIINE